MQTVCGSDGKDYRNECELHQYACKNQKNIRVQYQGHCSEIFFSFFFSSNSEKLLIVIVRPQDTIFNLVWRDIYMFTMI